MSKYDFDAVIIGGGAAGLTASGMAANFGARTMMVERDRLGGDCTWTGCVPSKILLKAGKVAWQIREAGKYGLTDNEPEINFHKLIEHLHERRQEIYDEADSPHIYEGMGIAVVSGAAEFINSHEVKIKEKDGNEQRVSSRYFFICAGSRPSVPPIEGIDTIPYLTSDTLFEIDNLPDELVIIGAGPIGTEMAQAMNRLGANVTVVDMMDRIMINDDTELTGLLQDKLESEGIHYILDANVQRANRGKGKTLVTLIEKKEGKKQLSADQILLAAGRRPNIESLGLDAAGIRYSPKGIEVNNKCQTSQSHIYACGDITGRYQFTHMSEHMAKVAVTNALVKFPMKIDSDHVPWVTFTDPELGHLGATQEQLDEEGRSYETYRFPYTKIDRALTDSEAEGVIKIYAKKWSGTILGVDILGVHAGELISEYAVAMKNGVSLRNIADTIHPYPSYGLGARRAADQWYIKNQTEWQVRLIQKIFGYRGEIPDLSNPDRII
ncbi:MAG: FAD-dependent oxidoreductase [Balneolaceae bacterium]|jgi:pyruvate/2-oxoglutarate dehydrogenase complex dihydrolipoamide dehydrogenase (E3) component